MVALQRHSPSNACVPGVQGQSEGDGLVSDWGGVKHLGASAVGAEKDTALNTAK